MASTSTGLPPNWTIRVSRSHNKEYFLNQSTNESSWDPPYGTDKEVLNAYIAKFKNNGYKPLVNEDGQVRVSFVDQEQSIKKTQVLKSPDGISRTRIYTDIEETFGKNIEW